ncbi:MAG: hypothetical protein IPM76_18630 [Chloroflexi bacterium]|nr:hypothetical protein [Chloroflexota bacterium]
MLVVVGRQDEAFVAGEFETAVTTHSDGEVHVIDGENHNSIVTSDAAMAIIETWLQDTQLAARKLAANLMKKLANLYSFRWRFIWGNGQFSSSPTAQPAS